MIKKLQTSLNRRVETEKLTFWRIFAAQIVLFFVIYGIMLVPRFSTDSYSVYFYTPGGLNGLLELGRTGTYLLYRFLLSIGVNSVVLSPVFTAVFILTVSWSAAVLLSLLKPAFPNPSRLTLLLLEFAVLLAYANIYFAELFFFSDVALMYTFAVLFLTLALLLFFRLNRVVGTIPALICLYFSLSFYQAFLGFFMIFGAMVILVRHDLPKMQREKKSLKPFVLDLLRLLIAGGGASAANVLVLRFLAAAGFASSRGPSTELSGVFSSIRQAIGQFRFYYPAGYPYYLTGFLKLIFVLSGPVLLYLLIASFAKGYRKHYPFQAAAITLLVLFAGLLLVFAPHMVAQDVWMPPRSICSFFALFTAMAVVTGCNSVRERAVLSFAPPFFVLLLLAGNLIGIQGIALDQIAVNRQDRAEAEEIVRAIQDYEAESGWQVDTISWSPDSAYTWTHPGIRFSFMDMNVRSGARSWSLIDCICYYAGRRFNAESMPDEIWAAYFAGQEWDSFRPEEQIRFSENKMYLMVY